MATNGLWQIGRLYLDIIINSGVPQNELEVLVNFVVLISCYFIIEDTFFFLLYLFLTGELNSKMMAKMAMTDKFRFDEISIFVKLKNRNDARIRSKIVGEKM